jgi:hypothetical protein
MEILKKQIHILLQKNILLQESTKEFMLKQLDISEERQLRDFVELLQLGLRETEKVFETKAKTDPSFVSKVQRFHSTVKTRVLVRHEEQGKKAEEPVLLGLEKAMRKL